MFGRLLHPPASKWRGPILVSALHKFVSYLHTYLLRHLFTYGPETHTGPESGKYRHQMPKLISYHNVLQTKATKVN